MESLLTVTNEAVIQLKKVIESAPTDVDGVLIGVEKGGCSGYSYKLDFVKKVNFITSTQVVFLFNLEKKLFTK